MSASIIPTLAPVLDKPTDRLAVMVDFPTPPLPEATAIILATLPSPLTAEEAEERYNERHNRWRELCESNYNTAEIIIAKQRHGPIGTIKAHFDSNFTKFSDLSGRDYDNVN